MERVGVFGTLSVSFVAATIMAALGLLTYTYASLQERRQQFAVLRAVGLYHGQVIRQVAVEYTILMVFGAIAGIIIGTLAATMFVPALPCGRRPGPRSAAHPHRGRQRDGPAGRQLHRRHAGG